jgi:hypothetical protein
VDQELLDHCLEVATGYFLFIYERTNDLAPNDFVSVPTEELTAERVEERHDTVSIPSKNNTIQVLNLKFG